MACEYDSATDQAASCRVSGRFRGKQWYRQRWKYIPVVFTKDQVSDSYEYTAYSCHTEQELEAKLMSATTYMYNRLKLRYEEDEEKREALKQNQIELLTLLEAAEAFSWQPLWLKRDTISQSIKWMKAYSVWTNVGSMVHEHLLTQAFFTKPQLTVYENRIEDEQLAEDDMLPGKPTKELFAPKTAVTQQNSEDNSMAFDAFCAARFSVPREDQYKWSSNRPQGGYDILGLQYAENAINGLRAALNTQDAKEELFLSPDSNLSSGDLPQCDVHVQHVAPEYPVMYPFGLSSAGAAQDTDAKQRASGYETRIDTRLPTQPECKAMHPTTRRFACHSSCCSGVQMRMEITGFAANFSNQDIPKHLIELACDTAAAQNYYRSTVSRRSQLQAESNAWMLYLDTGLLPSFCITLSATRRQPPKQESLSNQEEPGTQ